MKSDFKSFEGQVKEYFQTQQFTRLEAIARQHIASHANSGIAWKALGAALWGLDLKDAAIAAKREATRLLPNDPEAHGNLANSLQSMGHLDEACLCAMRVVALSDHQANSHARLGRIQAAKGELELAINSLETALQIDATCPGVHFELGRLHLQAGRFIEAEKSFLSEVRLSPNANYLDILLGDTYRGLKKLRKAKEHYRNGLSRQPNSVEAWNNLGNTLHDLGHLDEAIRAYERAIDVNPRIGEIHSNLGNVFKDKGEFGSAAICYRNAVALTPSFLGAHNNLLLTLNYDDQASSQARQAAAADFGAAASRLATRPYQQWRKALPDTLLRIGLVSGDLRNHPVGYFIEGMLRHIDKRRFQIYAFRSNCVDDDLFGRIRLHLDGCVDIASMSDADAAAEIHRLGIDLLFDLSGHTSHNRLGVFAWKPAPLQVSWLGYFATTGLTQMDYILADTESIPKGSGEFFVEQIYRLPNCRLCFTPPPSAPEISPLPFVNNGFMTFGSFQALAKITDEVLSVWAEVLSKVPESKLRIQSPQLGDDATKAWFQNRASQKGINTNQLRLVGRTSRDAYLDAYSDVDLILDTFPFPGGTTTCEALWMGVPTLTLRGNRMISRQGASLLRAAGMDEWIVDSIDDYVRVAQYFCSNPLDLASLRHRLRDSMRASPLCEAELFAKNIMVAIETIFIRQPAAPIRFSESSTV